MTDEVLKFFVLFFVVVEPVTLVPLFAAMTEGEDEAFRRKMALKAVCIAGIVLFLFAVGGASFLKVMGISIDAFRIAGGIMLFLIALEMVFARESGTRTSDDEKVESKKRADISVFPLAFPFMAGPGALTTLLLWFGPIPLTQHPVQFLVMFACALVVLALCLLAMWVAGPLMRVIGVTGTNVANRLFGVVLGALAVQFVVDGLRASFLG